MSDVASVEVWLSFEDACALAQLRGLARAARSVAPAADEATQRQVLRQLARLRPVRAAVRAACAQLPATTRAQHVQLGITPGMLRALRLLGYCTTRDDEGRLVCSGWRFGIGQRVQGGGPSFFPGLAKAASDVFAAGQALPRSTKRGAFLSAISGWRGSAPSATVASLLPELWLHLYVLQEGGSPPLGAPAPEPAPALADRVNRAVQEMFKAVERARKTPEGSAGYFAHELLQLRDVLYEIWREWLLTAGSQHAEYFRKTHGCKIPSDVSSSQPSQCQEAVASHQRIFTQRLMEHVGLEQLDLLNGETVATKTAFLKELVDETSRRPQLQDVRKWHAFYYVEGGRYRLVGQLGDVMIATDSRPWILTSGGLPSPPGGLPAPAHGERLVMGLPPQARGHAGEVISHVLTATRHSTSHLNQEFGARGESVLDSHNLELRAGDVDNVELGRVTKAGFLEISALPRRLQLLQLSIPGLRVDHASLLATAAGKAEAQPLTPDKFRRLFGQLQNGLGVGGTLALAATHGLTSLQNVDVNNFSNLFSTPTRGELGVAISVEVERLRSLAEKAPPEDRRRWKRSVLLVLHVPLPAGVHPPPPAGAPPPPAELRLEIDVGIAFDLTMWLLLTNKVPCYKGGEVWLEAFYTDPNSHEHTVPYPLQPVLLLS